MAVMPVRADVCFAAAVSEAWDVRSASTTCVLEMESVDSLDSSAGTERAVAMTVSPRVVRVRISRYCMC